MAVLKTFDCNRLLNEGGEDLFDWYSVLKLLLSIN